LIPPPTMQIKKKLGDIINVLNIKMRHVDGYILC
jgi:hypothetical protein